MDAAAVTDEFPSLGVWAFMVKKMFPSSPKSYYQPLFSGTTRNKKNGSYRPRPRKLPTFRCRIQIAYTAEAASQSLYQEVTSRAPRPKIVIRHIPSSKYVMISNLITREREKVPTNWTPLFVEEESGRCDPLVAQKFQDSRRQAYHRVYFCRKSMRRRSLDTAHQADMYLGLLPYSVPLSNVSLRALSIPCSMITPKSDWYYVPILVAIPPCDSLTAHWRINSYAALLI